MTCKARRRALPIAFACDAPGCTVEMDTGRFGLPDALATIMAAGWSVFRVGDDWRHTCPANHHVTRDDQ